MEILNVPISLIERYKGSKFLKEQLAFSICIKCLYSNSVLVDLNISRIAKLIGASRKRTAKLIEAAKANKELFAYSHKSGKLYAKSFKSKEVKTSKKGRVKYCSDFVYKLNKTKNSSSYSIKEMVGKLSEILIQNAIISYTRDKFTSATPKVSCSFCATTRDELTLIKLAHIAGVSKATAYRIVTSLEKCGIISKQAGRPIQVARGIRKEELDNWKKDNHCLRSIRVIDGTDCSFIYEPNVYKSTSGVEEQKFAHVIYTCSKRLKSTFYSIKATINKKATAISCGALPISDKYGMFLNPIMAAYE